MKLYQALILLSFSFGCSGADKDTGTADTGTADTGAAESFAPTEGSWSFGETEYTNDGCNLANNAATSPTVIDALVFTLASVSETEMTLTSAAGAEFNCTLEDMSLTCTSSSETEIETYNDLEGNVVTDDDGNPVDPDATRITDIQAVATFTDAETAVYAATVEADCSGADCDALATDWGISEIPCTSDYSGTFTLQD